MCCVELPSTAGKYMHLDIGSNAKLAHFNLAMVPHSSTLAWKNPMDGEA